MNTIAETIRALESGAYDRCLSGMYACTGDALAPYRQRFLDAIAAFREAFGDAAQIALFSAPGRTELGGNHTDHQGGHVLAGSVNLDIIAVAAMREDGQIRLKSEGFSMDCIDLADLQPVKEEENTSAALIRGIAAKFTEMGYPVRGFDAYTTSNVLRGSGLSSSAAFEVLVGNICSTFYADEQVDAVKIAQIGQYAENVYFGKPCGLMDQMASAVGGLVAIDFARSNAPTIRQVAFDLSACGYALCIIDTGGDHAGLTAEYAAIPNEMGKVAAFFDKTVLSEVPEEAFYEKLPTLREQCGDRAVLRAMHFYQEDRRVAEQVAALERGDLDAFLALVRQSGRSSYMYLQNVLIPGRERQEMALALALCERLLDGQGACRVHGGGFAGTVQAFVPRERLEHFRAGVEQVLGQGSCHVLRIRAHGGTEL